jgi:hypothetical protein
MVTTFEFRVKSLLHVLSVLAFCWVVMLTPAQAADFSEKLKKGKKL